jgi:hypothetical protein
VWAFALASLDASTGGEGKTIIKAGEKVVGLDVTKHAAEQFVKRNIPKKWISGVVNITTEDAVAMDEKGWEAIIYEFPRKLVDIVEFDIEVFEYPEDKEVAVETIRQRIK